MPSCARRLLKASGAAGVARRGRRAAAAVALTVAVSTGTLPTATARTGGTSCIDTVYALVMAPTMTLTTDVEADVVPTPGSWGGVPESVTVVSSVKGASPGSVLAVMPRYCASNGDDRSRTSGHVELASIQQLPAWSRNRQNYYIDITFLQAQRARLASHSEPHLARAFAWLPLAGVADAYLDRLRSLSESLRLPGEQPVFWNLKPSALLLAALPPGLLLLSLWMHAGMRRRLSTRDPLGRS